MTLYLLGILSVLISLIFYAPANIFDSYLSNRPGTTIPVIVFLNTLVPLIIIPFLLWFGAGLLPYYLWLPVGAITVIEVLYQFPYLEAFRLQNTSTVTALFSIGEILTPILAYFMVGERISFIQYAGFFLIIAITLALSYSRTERLKINASFFYMLAVSIVLVIQSVLYKYVFEHIDWQTAYLWRMVSTGVFVIGVFFIVGKWSDLKKVLQSKRVIGMIVLLNLSDTIAESLSSFSIALIPVTVSKGIGSASTLVVLGLSYALSRYLPSAINKTYKEKFNLTSFFLYVLLVIGVIMVSVK